MKRAILVALLALIPRALLAQAGSIAGTVTDEFGSPLADAAIQATNVATATAYRATSSATGMYTVGPLPAGRYVLLVTAPGRRLTAAVMVGSGETVRIDPRPPIDPTDVTLGTLGEADVRDIKRAVHPTPEGPTPRTADGKPDLSGMWWPQRIVDAGRPEPLP